MRRIENIFTVMRKISSQVLVFCRSDCLSLYYCNDDDIEMMTAGVLLLAKSDTFSVVRPKGYLPIESFAIITGSFTP